MDRIMPLDQKPMPPREHEPTAKPYPPESSMLPSLILSADSENAADESTDVKIKIEQSLLSTADAVDPPSSALAKQEPNEINQLSEVSQHSSQGAEIEAGANNGADVVTSLVEEIVDQYGGHAAIRKQWQHLTARAGLNQLTEAEEQELLQVEDIMALLKHQQKETARIRQSIEGNSETEESSLSSDEGSVYQEPSEDSPLDPSKTPRRKRAKPASNAREYVARLEARDKKRKSLAKQQGALKGRKLGNGRRATTKGDIKGISELRELLEGLKDPDLSLVDATVPAASSVVASTKAEQFAQLRQSIPDGCDLRRTATQARDLKEASRLFGMGKVKAVNGMWLLAGMQTTLRSHQLTASAWMVKRELQSSNPDGGILADRMGLGKTHISMGCIVGNPPDVKDMKTWSRATLVVVPNQSVVAQWQNKLIENCEQDLSTLQYSDRDKRPIKQIADTCVVIVTFGQVSRQYPSKRQLREFREMHEDDEFSFNKEVYAASGELFKVGWYRVILDEAHAIKNVNSQVTKACFELRKKYAWALSGTPIANNIEELYPYMKFIGVKSAHNLHHFTEKYVNNSRAEANLATLVSLVMYRRTYKDSFLGRQILDLPESHTLDLWVPISTEEAIIDEKINTCWKDIIEELKDNDGKEGSTKLKRVLACRARCLKLRQSVSHVFTLESVFREKLPVQHINELKQDLFKKGGKEKIVEQIQKELADDNDNENGLVLNKEISKFETGLTITKSLGLGGIFNMDALLELIIDERKASMTRCLLCNQDDAPEDPVRSKECGHIYCEVCLSQLIITAARRIGRGEDMSILECRHENCSAILELGESVKTLKYVEDGAAKHRPYKEPGTDSNGVRLRGASGCFTACAFKDDISLVPSSKLTAALAVMFTWMDEAPDDKILIFTQFVMTGKVLGRMLEMARVPFIYYFGETTQKQKNKALAEFNDSLEKKVMLVSLRSGGQSLNLTVANRVILVDPWWNTTVEQQAFSRVVRMGQKKPSYLVKIMVHGSIDETIAGIQGNKSKTVDRALQDDGHSHEVLDDESVVKLFTPTPDPETPAQGRQKKASQLR